jgi:hypothetical protein
VVVSGRSDLYNRQFHPDELKAIHDKANGDPAEEKKLTEAACYAVQCWAQYSPNSNEWLQNYVSPQEAAGLGAELQWVNSQTASNGLFNYTPWQQLKDTTSSQLDQAKGGAQQLGQDLLNLPHDLLNQVPQIPSNVQQGDASPLVDVTNGGNGTPPTPAVVTPTTVMTPEGPVPGPTVAIPGSPGYVPSTATLNSGNNGEAQGNVNVEPGATPDPNEVRAGQGLANQGYDVTHQPTASSQGVDGVRTADLSINGVGQVDVYTPVNTNPNSIVRNIEAKFDQANGVVVQADLSEDDMASIAARTWGKPNGQNFNTIFFQNSDGQVFRFNRPVGGEQ